MTDSPSDILTLLRVKTAALHDQLERDNPMNGPSPTMDDYIRFAVAAYPIFFHLEPQLAARPEWSSYDIEIEDRKRLPYLAADLATLGVQQSELKEPDLLPKIKSFGHALGVLYVLEGSRLGGQILLRRLIANCGPQVTHALSFFSGSGTELGTSWKKFILALRTHSKRHPSEDQDIVNAAVSTFNCFGRLFSNPGKI